ncbi:DUF1700 domain-containing protein [Candidatus Xianfuyuplasma coldseepsis]|uniref:DUF1700 domain-containing protein n=1 Tax=Candidatus Xianfuyuplasma coldseepsis TaxID=2782163 RepID=A0A7L7KQP6_9MOLU|nr:DUF1700 domain-containing protein [Xianfuyuplasma coldseepsis]QMS84546.1 DUF1700 domain-containing protein [Xianfuyuplasma coldseepsis]
MKDQYLNRLKTLLSEYVMDEQEMADILQDYDEMYDNYKDYGMQDNEIEDKLGSPEKIIGDLTDGYIKKVQIKEQKQESKRTKIIAISPFVALVLFFVGGFGFGWWAYSWTAFLLIPMVAIISEMAGQDKHVFVALSPFIALIGFGILGFGYELWHPGWLIFLIIPVIAITTDAKGMSFLEYLTAISTFIALPIYFLYFGPQDMWVPGWLIFLMIPIIGALNETNKLRMFILEFLIIGGAVAYVYIGETYQAYDWALLAFVPIAVYGLFSTENKFFDMPREYRLLVLVLAAGYVAAGLIGNLIDYNLWGYAWLLFLLIPVYAITKETNGNERAIAITPFIAVFIFYSLGYFFGWWAFSWLAFLLIPVVAILKEA